jgi:hypothetical protein
MLKNLCRSNILLIIIMLVFAMPLIAQAASDIPLVIEKPEQAKVMQSRALSMLKGKLGMSYRLPIEVKLVTGAEIDKKISDSPYKGNSTGIYCFENGKHVVYMMKDTGSDDFFGVICHELTHAWQSENCPGQDIILKEGLAQWVQYKCLMWDGAYIKANAINQNLADPVYGVGYRFVQRLEDKYKEKGVLEAVKKLKSVPDGEK